MDRRWVNTVSETSWCWPEYCMLSGSVEQRNCKLEKNLLIQRWVSLDGNIWPKITLALFYFFLACYHFISMSALCLVLQILLFLTIPPAISPPADFVSLGPVTSFSLPLIKYNIYLSLFEFTHPYHWVCSQWLWGGLVEDSLTLHWPWNMHITIKGDGVQGSISTRAHNLEFMCFLKPISAFGPFCPKLQFYK